MNIVIIAALAIQIIISKTSRIAGAIAGYLITTGILIWGLSAYADGAAIVLFGIELSKAVFVIACLVWYGFDTAEFINARKEADMVNQTAEIPDDTIESDEPVKSSVETDSDSK
jgi:hypothetical protein